MVIFFVLICLVDALRGMEIEQIAVPQPMESFEIPSLKELARAGVYRHIVNGEISIVALNALPHDVGIQDDIKKTEPIPLSFKMPLSSKDVHYCELSTLTESHHYLLMKKDKLVERFDLRTYETLEIGTFNDLLEVALSPSGNLVACVSPQKLSIIDIAQCKVREDTKHRGSIKHMAFIGEKGLIIKEFDQSYFECINSEELEKWHTNTFRFLGVLQAPLEYVIQTCGTIARYRVDGILNPIAIKYLPEISRVDPAIYEPKMLMACETCDNGQESGIVEIVSLNGKSSNGITENLNCCLAQLQCGKNVKALTFANKGQWLIVVMLGSNLVIWDWKKGQKIYKYPPRYFSAVSYTDELTPFPCIFKASGIAFVWDPIKAVAAAMFLKNGSSKTEKNSNNKNNN